MSTAVPDSRVYIHARCGQPTEISGPQFAALADPLATMEWTVCSHCEQQDDLSAFTWADTGESIPAYYERYRKAIPAADRARASRSRMFRYLIIGGMLGLLISIVLGLFVGLLFGLWLGVLAAVLCTLVLSPLGGVLGFMHFEKHVVKPIVRRALQVEDVRQLR